MSRYNVLYLSRKSVWFDALELGFTQLARTNPGWSFTLSTQQEVSGVPDLYILDLTAATKAYIDAFPVVNSRMLLLVHAAQKKLIRHILAECRCSVLCVDEYFFSFRDVVEASIRKKRFLSPFIRDLSIPQPVVAQADPLTEAESKVLEYIREGKNGVEISQALFRSQKTVSSHKRNIMRKLGVRDDLGLKQKILAMDEMAK